MSSYRFYLHGKNRPFPACESVCLDTDSDARNIAVTMLRDRPLIDWLEVWRDADLVFRVNRHKIADQHLA